MKDNYLSRRIFIGFNYTFLVLFSLFVFLPFWSTFLVSLTREQNLRLGFSLFPKEIYLGSYRLLFKEGNIIRAFFNSLKVTGMGIAMTLFFTMTFAYTVTRKDLYGLNQIYIFMLIPGYFSGGMIPMYLLIRNLRMLNTYWALTVPSSVSFYYILLTRNYFRTIPFDLIESARIDGAKEMRIIFSIMMPLAAPIIAAVTLFSGVSFWNQYFTAVLYINDFRKMTYQVILREMLAEMQIDVMQIGETGKQEIGESLKMAATYLGFLPVLIAYPFAQKYFTKGIIVGSIKG